MKKQTPTPPALGAAAKERLRKEASYRQLMQAEGPPAELVEEALCALPEEAARQLLDEANVMLPDKAGNDQAFGAVMWRMVALARLHLLSTEYGTAVVTSYAKGTVSVASLLEELKADLGSAWAKMVAAGFPSWKQIGQEFRTWDGFPNKRFKTRSEAISAFMAARFGIDAALSKAMAASAS